ncbi:MAG: hypothetical protein IJ925_02535 [Muribaculaceae bacterium]|jgi:hypothetical protein|nr:hypothetical protein [Muribaculaceae bacterium]
MRDKVIFLVAGIIISVLFFIFKVTLYDALYYSNGFSNDLGNIDEYTSVAAITIAMAWGGAAIYYYAINSVKFDRWYHWLATLGVVAVLTPVVDYFVTSSILEGKDYGSAIVSFELHNIVFAALMFIIASFSMRWWSSNCRHTPIPQ